MMNQEPDKPTREQIDTYLERLANANQRYVEDLKDAKTRLEREKEDIERDFVEMFGVSLNEAAKLLTEENEEAN